MKPDKASQFLEAMEAGGASDLASSNDRLPQEFDDYYSQGDARLIYAELGITVIRVDPLNPSLFYKVELPQGWTLMPTGHDMWTDLLDENGAKRLAIFFKASPHDLRAFSRPLNRYTIGMGEVESRDLRETFCSVMDSKTGKILFSTERSTGKTAEKYQKCLDWLDEHFPKHLNWNAYWDEE